MNQLTEALRELAAPSPYRYAVRVAGLALAYFLAARIGLEYAVANLVISTVWPASGIALAAVLLGGLRLLPAVFIGAFAVNYSIQGSITVSAITGLGNSLEVLLGTLLLRRVLDFDVRVSRLRDVVCLIVVAATIEPLPAQGSSSFDGINENITKSGDTIICRWHNTVLSNAAGELRGYMAMAEDVTAMTRAQRAIRESEERFRALTALSSDWYWLAVDDFGTGYSSLAYLKQLPIDTLKIDRTFVRDIETDSDDAAIIGAIIAMAHGLDVRVTAEGVETKGQMEALRKLGCDEFQGYLLSKPLPAGEFAAQFLAPAKKKVRKAAASARARASRGRARRA